jgi:hypothetical protein
MYHFTFLSFVVSLRHYFLWKLFYVIQMDLVHSVPGLFYYFSWGLHFGTIGSF